MTVNMCENPLRQMRPPGVFLDADARASAGMMKLRKSPAKLWHKTS
jgi:hypothetical protein